MIDLYQGDILKIDNIPYPVFIVSKRFFNASNGIIGCPIVKDADKSAIHFPINLKKVAGYVLCEQLRFFDIKTRGYKVIDHSDLASMTEVVDIVQGFFDFN